MLYPMSNLNANDLAAIKALENDIGCSIVAVSQIDIEHLDVSDEQLKKIQELEKRLGVMLIATKA